MTLPDWFTKKYILDTPEGKAFLDEVVTHIFTKELKKMAGKKKKKRY